MKKIIARFAKWLSSRAGVVLIERPNTNYVAAAKEFAAHVESAPEPWEWKHRQTIRAMRNRFPDAPIRDLNLAIEVAIQECSVSGF